MRVFRCVTCIAVALLLCIADMPTASAATTVTFLTTEYPPYTSTSQAGSGAMARLLTAALATQGYQVRFVFLPWARVPRELAQADGAFPCWPNEIRRFGLQAGQPLFESRLGFYVRSRQSPSLDTSLAGLHGRRVGIVRGYGYPDVLFSAGLQLEEVSDDETNLRKLAADRIDAAVLERAVGDYLLTDVRYANLRGKVTWQEPAFATVPLLVGVVARRPNSEKLLRDIDLGVERLRRTGQLSEFTQGLSLDMAPDGAETGTRPRGAQAEK